MDNSTLPRTIFEVVLIDQQQPTGLLTRGKLLIRLVLYLCKTTLMIRMMLLAYLIVTQVVLELRMNLGLLESTIESKYNDYLYGYIGYQWTLINWSRERIFFLHFAFVILSTHFPSAITFLINFQVKIKNSFDQRN